MSPAFLTALRGYIDTRAGEPVTAAVGNTLWRRVEEAACATPADGEAYEVGTDGSMKVRVFRGGREVRPEDGGNSGVSGESQGALIPSLDTIPAVYPPPPDEFPSDAEGYGDHHMPLDDIPAYPPPPAGTLQARQWEWVQATFPDETFEGVLDHLKEEIVELEACPSDPGELADVFLLVQCLASHFGVDLMAAAEAKLRECRSREWEFITGKGYRHKKPLALDDYEKMTNDALAAGKCRTCGVPFGEGQTAHYMQGECKSCGEIPF